jgi:uncharacterized membrane protein YbhN (UPF0104 family)
MSSPPPPSHAPSEAQARGAELPGEVAPHRLRRGLLQACALLVALVLVALLAPGLGEVRELLARIDPFWIGVAVLFEVLSCASYIMMFRPIFCRRMGWRTSWEIAGSELAVGSFIPASGAGGLALGAWVLHRGGMAAERIARRSVAFFLIKSSVNFIAVAGLGTLMAVGLVGPHRSLLLTALPAAGAFAVLGLVLALPRLGPGPDPPPGASSLRRAVSAARRALITGSAEALGILRSGDPLVILGAIGYYAWDNALLWATYQAVGVDIPIAVVMMGYLIGQLGGLLPLPAGVGGVDGGLIGALILYGAPPAATVAAVLAFRLVLFWVPLIGGAVAFASLRRALERADRSDLQAPAPQP